MQKFLVKNPDISGSEFILTDKSKVHHIKNVLHLRVGARAIIFDGKGNEYDCAIKEFLKDSILFSVEKKMTAPRNGKVRLSVACALPKKSKFDDIVDKLVQLGVDKIIPLKTERVIVNLDKAKELSRLERWNRIAESAAQQSQRSDTVVVTRPLWLEEVLMGSEEFDLKIMPTLVGRRKALKEVLSHHKACNILVLIGPEGDFTKEEVDLAKSAGCIPVSLGELVLRVETAAVAVSSYVYLALE